MKIEKINKRANPGDQQSINRSSRTIDQWKQTGRNYLETETREILKIEEHESPEFMSSKTNEKYPHGNRYIISKVSELQK